VCFNSVFTHDFESGPRLVIEIVKGEGLLKVTGSHVHWKK